MKKKILFITPYPFDESPSQRFRFEQFFDDLTSEHFSYRQHSFFSQKQWAILYRQGHLFPKLFGVFSGYVKRFFTVFSAFKYDYIFIHREATPLGPPIFEWFFTHLTKAQVIYDFDDAIWLSDQNNRWITKLKWLSKVGKICKWVDHVSVGNDYLATFARLHSKNVSIIPTSIKINQLPVKPVNDHLVIGWTGTHSTLKYLEKLQPLIEDLALEFDFEFVLIGNKNSHLHWPNSTFIKWSKATEWEDLSRLDIGIMPLPDNKWTQGKCGFKALQYMALSIPVVCSPVGVNKDIIIDGKNGFLANNDLQWKKALSELLSNSTLRHEIGKKGQLKFSKEYSQKATIHRFMLLFE